MNDLLFAALIMALLYYFFIYLPQQATITETKQKLAMAGQENAKNEQVLEQLIKEFWELNSQL